MRFGRPRRCPISRVSTSGRMRVPANSLSRVKRRFHASFEVGMRTPGARPRQHPARPQGAPTSVPGRRRCRGQLAVGRSEEETRRPMATCSRSGRVAWLRFLRGGAQTTRTGSNCFLWMGATRHTGRNLVSHSPHEPPFDLQRKGSGGGGRTRGTATQVAPANREGQSPTLLGQEPRGGRCP